MIRYRDDERLIFYDLQGDEGDSISVRESGDAAYAFSPSGRHWYIFRAESGRLLKARTWW